MADSGGITLEKTKTQELSLLIRKHSDTLQTNASIVENSSVPPQIHVLDPIKRPNLNLEKNVRFFI